MEGLGERKGDSMMEIATMYTVFLLAFIFFFGLT
jgi:hypothetical protein